jgi:3-oxoacyl-[acyl-carrier-protein] synthase-3
MMAETGRAALAEAGLGVADVTRWIPHQANSRIIEATRKQVGLAPEAVVSTVAEYANSSAATIPFTWSMASAGAGVPRGAQVLLTAAGAGLTGGSVVWGG